MYIVVGDTMNIYIKFLNIINVLYQNNLYIIRFHSLYPYHEHVEYSHLTNNLDKKMFSYLKLFNKYDLYTKCENKEITKEMKEYYDNLVKKYLNNGELYF